MFRRWREAKAAFRKAQAASVFLARMTSDERIQMVVYMVYSNDTPLTKQSTQNEINQYLYSLSLEELEQFAAISKVYERSEEEKFARQIHAAQQLAQARVRGQEVNFFVPEGFSPIQIFTVSRNLGDTENLTLHATLLDDSEFVPVSPKTVGELLIRAGETLIEQQNTIDRMGEQH